MGKGGTTPRRIFYRDDGLVVVTDPVWLQGSFNTLIGLFDLLGLRKNVRKTLRVIFGPFCIDTIVAPFFSLLLIKACFV